MRKILFIVLLAGLCCLNACHRQSSYPPLLLQADSLASVEPQHALDLLQGMEEEMAGATKATQMYYKLLCIKAADKAYIPHTTDSLILPVVNYYEQGGDPNLLGEAYYYAGRVYRDLNDAPQALAYFQKGLEASSNNQGKWVNAVLYAQMGEIFYYQSLYPNALQMYGEAYRLDSIAGDTIGCILDLRDLAFTHRALQQPDTALVYLQQAERLADLCHDGEMKGLIQSQLAGLYNQQGNYTEAIRHIEEALPLMGDADRFSAYDVYANILLNKGELEKAKGYYEQMLQAEEATVRLDAYDGLAYIAAQKRQADEYLRYFELYKACSDTIRRTDATESVSRMNAMYNYQLRENENIRLQEQVQQHRQLLQRIIFVACMALFVLIIYLQYSRRRRLRMKLNLERLQQLQEEQYRQSEEFIQSNKEEIAKLQTRLDEANHENSELIQRLERQKELLINANMLAAIKQEEKKQVEATIAVSPVMKQLQERMDKGEFLKSKDVKEIEKLLNKVCPAFLPLLRQLGGMSSQEYQVSLLLKMNLTPMQISSLILRDKSTISAIRRRLYKKITGLEGSPADWDAFIQSLGG